MSQGTLPNWLSSGQGGTPLILLHGMGSTASIWLPQLDYFGAGRLTAAWSTPGYGVSPALPTLSWAALADALNQMLETLKIEKAHILGHSIGGMIAQEFYHRHPSRVASLILSATSSGFGSSDPAWQEAFLRQRTEPLNRYRDFAEAAPTMLADFMGPDTPPLMQQLAHYSASSITAERYLDYMRLLLTFNRRTEAPAIKVPTLLLAGEHDSQAPPKGMQRLAQQIPNARFHEIKDARHMANIENPAKFNHVVAAFLESVDAESAVAH